MATDLLLKIEQCKELSSTAKSNIITWLTHEKFSAYLSELEGLIQNKEWQLLEDAFFRVIPFGTGGRRGTVGIGSNRINDVTVGEVAQAVCLYLSEVDNRAKEKGVVIAYDSRNTSRYLTELFAGICAANGYRVYVYKDVRSTPQLSFSVRMLGTAAGIVVSASHNPSPDNGVKVYWNDGGQMVPPYDKELLAVAEGIEVINTMSFSEGLKKQLIVELEGDADEAYYQAVLHQAKQRKEKAAIIAYSPLHGAGRSSVYPVIQRAGFDIRLLEEQANYDGNFTNVTNHIANPEVPEASDKVVAFAKAQKCDIAITTDPDADRLGVVVTPHDKPEQYLTGNQTSVLIAYNILENMKKTGKLKKHQFIGKTIVTTDMLYPLAKEYGVEVKGDLLVGFKYIGELIKLFEDEGKQEFLFGGEESYGGLVGTYARDKDAASSALMIAELTSSAKAEGKTLIDVLDELYEQYGYYHETLSATSYPGADGFKVMKHIMNSLRSHPPTEIAGMKVVRVRDYITGNEIKGRAEDVLRFELSENGSDRVTIRPSGTEPKIKIYVQTKTEVLSDLEEAKKKGTAKADQLTAASKAFLTQ